MNWLPSAAGRGWVLRAPAARHLEQHTAMATAGEPGGTSRSLNLPDWDFGVG